MVFEDEFMNFLKIYLGRFETQENNVGSVNAALRVHQMYSILDLRCAAELLFEHFGAELNPLFFGRTGDVDDDGV